MVTEINPNMDIKDEYSYQYVWSENWAFVSKKNGENRRRGHQQLALSLEVASNPLQSEFMEVETLYSSVMNSASMYPVMVLSLLEVENS